MISAHYYHRGAARRRGQMIGVYERRDLTARDVVSLIIGADELETDVSGLDDAAPPPNPGPAA